MRWVFWSFVFLNVLFASTCFGSPDNFTITVTININFSAYVSAIQLAVDDANNNPNILPNTILQIEQHIIPGAPGIITKMIELSDLNRTVTVGNGFSGVSVQTGIVGAIYGIAQISGVATSPELSENRVYPFFSRLSAKGSKQMLALRDSLLFYGSNRKGWTDVGIITHTNIFGVALAETFIAASQDKITILTFQQFLYLSEDYDVEMKELAKSGSRAIIALLYAPAWPSFISAADSFGLVGENYVWFVPSPLVGSPIFPAQTEERPELARGILGTFEDFSDTGPVYDKFLERWLVLDKVEYPGSGTFPTFYTRLAYDMTMTTALACDQLDKNGLLDQERVPAEDWTEIFRTMEYEGLTGKISLDEFGDREIPLGQYFYNPDTQIWTIASSWSEESGFENIQDVVWFSNTTEIPDLDIRPPFDYWSCDDKKEKEDPTGKTVTLHTPDGSHIDDIDSNYHCDGFLDCYNMSDESTDCSQNYIILFIIFGTVTCLLIFIALGLFVFVGIFGFILGYQRLKVSSPFFLLLILFSIIVGYLSVFAWFGKPHPVACAFQPWLLGLSSISMIAALCTKTFRIWRIFRSKTLKKQKITDFELLGLWAILMIPVLIILTIWTIVSTPTAEMKERDGEDHYVCTTGGFTGEPGGYVFFAILAAYAVIILLFGIFLSIVTRKVPSLFNESKLVAISIYNLSFLSVVIIPVFLVIQPFNPFLAWILRTISILYAFTATMVLQFFGPVFGIIFYDKFKNNRNLAVTLKRTTSTSLSGAQKT